MGVSDLVAIVSLVVSLVAFWYSTRTRLTVGRTFPVPGGYEVEIVNVGERAARHVAVHLADKEDQTVSERVSGAAILPGERRVISLPLLEGITLHFPLRIRWKFASGFRGSRTKESGVSIDDQHSNLVTNRKEESEREREPLSLVDRRIPVRSATVEDVWNRLEVDWQTSGVARMDGTWEDKLRRFEEEGILGEVRRPEDWQRLPRGIKLYAVAIEQNSGISLRWASEAASGPLEGMSHRKLHRGSSGRARKGFISVIEMIQVDP